MANFADIATSIASALNEIGVNGTVDVRMEGDHVHASVGHPTGADIDVAIVVTSAEPRAVSSPSPLPAS